MSHVNLHEVQTQTNEAIGAAQTLVYDAELWLGLAQECYDRQDHSMFDGLPGACDSALLVYRLGNLAETRIVIDKRMVDLKVAMAKAKDVRIQCAIDLAKAYARRDEAALQGALQSAMSKRRNWYTA